VCEREREREREMRARERETNSGRICSSSSTPVLEEGCSKKGARRRVLSRRRVVEEGYSLSKKKGAPRSHEETALRTPPRDPDPTSIQPTPYKLYISKVFRNS
jgi:hypothetical protein